MRAPQYGRMPRGPNPAIAKGLRVAPFAKIFALVDGLGCISLHKTEADAKTALEQEQERRKALERGQPVAAMTPADAKRANEREAGD